MKIGAFADKKRKSIEPELIIPNTPFSTLLSDRTGDDNKENNSDGEESDSGKTVVDEREQNGNSPSLPPTIESRVSDLTMVSTNDDFIMVDLVIFALTCF